MAVWQYRCISCGNVHEAPLRPDGSVYLRCVATREWAWYDPGSFAAVAVAEIVPVGATRKVAARSSRAAARHGSRRSTSRAARGRAAPKRSPRARRKKR